MKGKLDKTFPLKLNIYEINDLILKSSYLYL